MKKRILSLFLVLALFAAVVPFAPSATAKTSESAKAEKIFFYAGDVLLKVVTLDELKAISHGQTNGENYYISSTDNYPTTQYCEARGVTIPELIEYVKSVTTVPGAEKLTFKGNDTLRLMATDSFGNYNRSWTYDELYGEPRYYFEGLFSAWNTGWEISGEDNSKFGISLKDYNEKYAATDPYFTDKRNAFASGVRSEPILATESFSGRTTTDSLTASTEPGIAEYITRNGNIVAGCLKDALTDETALRLALPMTEADLMAAHRTAFDNFKWTYNLKLESSVKLEPLGRVAEPIASATVKGNELSFAITCATEGASVYYSFDGAPQTPYTKPVTMDVTSRDLAKSPVTIYVTAVKEGYSDAGIVPIKYPGTSPALKTVFSGIVGEPLTFGASDGVAVSDWSAWTAKMQFVTVKAPGSAGYVRVDADKYKFAASEVTFDGTLFAETGSYSFVFHATGYADKTVTITIKRNSGGVKLTKPAVVGEPLTFTFDAPGYKSGATLYVTPPNGERIMFTSAKLETYVPNVPGEYLLSFVNTQFEPSTLELIVTVNRNAPLEFLFFGDIQMGSEPSVTENYAAFERLAKAAITANPNAAFALQAGDIVESGISATEWDAFVTAKGNALGTLPFYPTNGNHESNFLSGKPEEYLRRFELPQNGPEGFKGEFYSFEQGGVHIASLNSWVFSGEQKLTDAELAQLDEWVRTDLLNSNAEWKFVLTHLPLYPVHSDATALKMQEHWRQIFEDCGVQLVLVGHQHVYSRLEPQRGITQIMGNSGLKFYGSADETLAAVTLYNVTTYQTVSVTGGSLTVGTFDINGNELDTVTISRMTRGEFAALHPEFTFIGYEGGDMGWSDPITAQQIRILNERNNDKG